ncbi:IS200/IS605 family transposase [Methyloprofundus sp.]|uniref:IS200/IS605 family transposase n=1 Tax=Methyloprofundus sp. TaxID=2020875 RepID=UPI003D0B44F7
MSRFKKSSHVILFCQYPIVFVPKYRYRVLKGDIGKFVYQSIYAHTERSGCEIIELNVQPDHVHLLVKVPPKISISDLVGKVKGKTAIQAFQKFPNLRTKKYWGNHFWSAGYCVDTVRHLDSDETNLRPFPNFLRMKSAHKLSADRFLDN